MSELDALDYAAAIKTAASRPHPRLLANHEGFTATITRRGHDELLRDFLLRSQQDAEYILDKPPVTHIKEGSRLLSVSRLALRRVLLLGLHSRLTGMPEFAERAIAEMLAAASFSDWNPSHSLDVAEMTTALAIGFDWLHEKLTPEQHRTIRRAIVDKGLRPLLVPKQEWHTGQHNRNPVCLGGLLLGALALAEEEAELATEVLAFVRKYNVYGLMPYQPAGVYPEGHMYWSYGTTYQALLISALETCTGNDFGISQSPGFLPSAAAILQVTAPSGRVFNFSDGLEETLSDPVFFWFARRLQSPSLLKFERPLLENYVHSPAANKEGQNGRFFPLIALWWPENWESTVKQDAPPLYWYGLSRNPLGVFRSNWDSSSAAYLAFKGGRAHLSHGHMDVGSFIFEAGGVRWASDLGAQDYLSLESKGVKMWDFKQEGERWQVFHLGPHSHNTLTINGHLHVAKGAAAITHFSQSPPAAIMDLTEVFKDEAQSVRRGFRFDATGSFLVRDELTGLTPGDEVRWAMVTKATISVQGNVATLTHEGKKLTVENILPDNCSFQVIPLDQPMRPYDAPNPGYSLLAIKAIAPASGSVTLAVQLALQGATASFPTKVPLDEWNLPPIQEK